MLQFPLVPSAEQFQEEFTALNKLIKSLVQLPHSNLVRSQVFHQEILKSSLFSARIEGNTLTLVTAKQTNFQTAKDRRAKEVSNVMGILSTLNRIQSPLSVHSLRKIHGQVMRSLDGDAGQFRSESSAIYNQYGTIVYITPSPNEMLQMITSWLEHISSQQDLSWQKQLLLIAASHYYFEKIHPFLDGNGRTGRVVLQLQLQHTTLFEQYLIPIDQYFDEHKREYYTYLERNSRNVTDFCGYFLRGVLWATRVILEDISQMQLPEKSKSLTANLLPRRQEIVAIITDHPYIGLDALARRFPTVPRRTISYDVSALVKLGLVIMHGKTRGVRYSAAS